jgi:hypothetical protein
LGGVGGTPTDIKNLIFASGEQHHKALANMPAPTALLQSPNGEEGEEGEETHVLKNAQGTSRIGISKPSNLMLV